MAQPLAHYSIETDNTVFLTFMDGSSQRVPFTRIEQVLADRDLKRVKQGMALRRGFLHRHMPRFFVAILVASLALVGGLADEHQWAQLVHPKTTAAKTAPVRTLPASSTVASPSTPTGTLAPTQAHSVTIVSSTPASSPALHPAAPSRAVVPTVTKTVNQTVRPVMKTVTKLVSGLLASH